jgi:hypothetical protein
MILFVPADNQVEALSNTYDPTEESTFTGFPEFSNPENAYTSDDNYADSFGGSQNISLYSGYGTSDMGTEITTVEIGVEIYVDANPGFMRVQISCDGGTTWLFVASTSTTLTKKLVDDDNVQWFDVTSIAGCSPWSWDWLSDGNLMTYMEAAMGAGNRAHLDYYPVRVTHSGSFHIQMLNPQNGDTVFNTIDFVSKVTADTAVEQVTYYFNSLYHVATFNGETNTFIYPEFNTKTLGNGYYTVIARANLTSSQYATKSILIRVDNAQDKDCYFDDVLNIWVCPQVRTYVPDRSVPFGIYETTKASTQTYWEAFYWYIEKSTDATSHALYSVVDSTTYTDNNVIMDWMHIDDYVPTNRIYVNDTKSTASVADDTELENDTYQSFVSLSGQNITVNCTVSTDVERYANVFIAKNFDWSINTATNEYNYAWSFTNNLQSTIKKFAVQIPFEVAADVGSVEVWDTSGNIQLDAQKDYGVTTSAVEIGLTSLSASTTKEITITFSPYVTGTDILKPTITILEGDIESQPVIRNSHTYNRANKDVYNSNNFDYAGIMIVHWQTTSKPDWASFIVEDSDGSTYEWYIELGQLIVKDVSLDRHATKTFYFYFDTVSTDPVESLLELIILVLIVILAIGLFISMAYWVTEKDQKQKNSAKTIVLIFLTLLGIVGGSLAVYLLFL